MKFFLEFLKNQPVKEFYLPLKKKIKRVPLNFRKTLKILKNKKIKCYLVSLTSEEIAKEVSKKFNFANYMCIKFLTYKKSNKLYFSGKIQQKITTPNKFKLKSYKKFKIKNPRKECICFGDSLDDLLLLNKSKQSFVVGKNKKLISSLKNNPVIIEKNWEKIKLFY